MKDSNNLINSLEKKSNSEFLRRITDSEDEKVLKLLKKNSKDMKISNTKDVIRTLWECCQIPDFSKKSYGNHVEVVKKIFEIFNIHHWKSFKRLYENTT